MPIRYAVHDAFGLCLPVTTQFCNPTGTAVSNTPSAVLDMRHGRVLPSPGLAHSLSSGRQDRRTVDSEHRAAVFVQRFRDMSTPKSALLR